MVPAQNDVRPSSRHVGRHGDHTQASSLGDGLILSGNGLGASIEKLRLHARFAKSTNDGLGHLNIGRAYQNRATIALVVQNDFLNNSIHLRLLCLVNHIRVISAHVGTGRWDSCAPEPVDFFEFSSLRECCPCHGTKSREQAEQRLVGDLCRHLRPNADINVLLGFNGLVHSVGPTATLQHSTSEGIDNGNLPVPDDVLLAHLEKLLGLDSIQNVQNPGFLWLPQVLHPQQVLCHFLTQVGQHGIHVLLIYGVVQIFLQCSCHFLPSLELSWDSRHGF
mmetsp:Transcript_4605/g.10806  ORF Transcript_4605/g.10806 Transcript_4605/m.10806 type:complete len:278 (+) Transcript_4605:1397-2230(+)